MSPFEKLQKAAALKYNESSDEAPVVVASGMGDTARRIVALAEKSGVPVFRDDSLATLLSRLDAGVQIPPEMYRAVVDIYVYFLGFRADSGGRAFKQGEKEQNESGPQENFP
jgi:flagellar biosynthesis protein